MSKIVKSCLNYQGNKYKLLKERRIHEFLPKINHDSPYCELFCGSAVMFFNIDATFAYLNDINQELQNFWKVITYQYEKFSEILKNAWPGFQLESLSEIERAVQFYISNINSCYITKPMKIQKNLSFWRSKLDSSRINLDNKPFDEEMDYLTKLYTNNVEERPCRIIFYQDPPYWGMENVYKSWRKDQTTKKQTKFDHQLLADKNHQAREEGHFILLSYNDVPEIRELYQSGWYFISYKYNPNGKQKGRAKERKELLISSHPFERRRGNKSLKQFF